MPTEKFVTWATGYSGCDGGDLGSVEKPSTWVCGIEWGGGHSVDALQAELRTDYTEPPLGYDNWKHNLEYHFNRRTCKLLSVIEGGTTADYKDFAYNTRPFTSGQNGYFKLNLYPVGFPNTKASHWKEQFSTITGLSSKNEYIEWCRNNRFPVIKNWSRKHKPKLIIGFGKTYRKDFWKAFGDSHITMNTETICGKEIAWAFNGEGSLVVITPFPTGPHGLNSDLSMTQVGQRIRSILGTPQPSTLGS
jgi:hypothetical protein